jgi:hypothetical protein
MERVCPRERTDTTGKIQEIRITVQHNTQEKSDIEEINEKNKKRNIISERKLQQRQRPGRTYWGKGASKRDRNCCCGNRPQCRDRQRVRTYKGGGVEETEIESNQNKGATLQGQLTEERYTTRTARSKYCNNLTKAVNTVTTRDIKLGWLPKRKTKYDDKKANRATFLAYAKQTKVSSVSTKMT